MSLLGLFQCVAATAVAGAFAYGAVYSRGKWLTEAPRDDAKPEAMKSDAPEPEPSKAG